MTNEKTVWKRQSDEKIIWSGSPSQFINLGVYVITALTFYLIIPIFYAFYKWLDAKCIRFDLTNERILMHTGILTRRLDDLELYRVKDICLIEPLLLRIFHLSNIELITSDPTFPDIVITGVSNGNQLRETIRRLVMEARERKQVREIDYYHEK